MARPKQSHSKRAGRAPPLDPQALNAALLAAVEHQREGRLEEAAQVYRQVEARNPEDLNTQHLHALVEIEQGHLTAAADRLRSVLRRSANWFEAWTSLAYVYSELGQWRDAVAAHERALEIRPGDIGETFALATGLEVVGRLDEAIALYRRLAELPGTRMSALIRIAQSRIADLSHEEIEAMAAAGRDEATSPTLRTYIYSSLGEMYERAGDYDRAFEAFATANRIRHDDLANSEEPPPSEREMAAPENKPRSIPPQAAARNEARRLQFVKNLFSREFLTEHSGHGSPVAAPIFIVGMPRCGSTLLEQILSSHPKVQGMGESRALSNVVAGEFPYSLSAPCPPGHFRRLAQDYLADLHARGWKNTARVVDKSLPNFFHVGVLSLMFPNAVIIDSMRDPVDNCLACFRQQFGSWETLYDLRDIGETYVRYRQMMEHWDEVLPGRVVRVSHEALVADPDVEIRRLVTEVCGLPWDDACLSFYDTQRPVRTASVAQVRQPIFKTSVERWRRYEKHLGPLFEALGPYAPAR
jgi:tetratricopeptide (TPR) repeat protein